MIFLVLFEQQMHHHSKVLSFAQHANKKSIISFPFRYSILPVSNLNLTKQKTEAGSVLNA